MAYIKVFYFSLIILYHTTSGKNGRIYVDEFEKAQLLNDFFTPKAHLDESNAKLPSLAPFNGTPELDSIILNYIEVESVLKSLATGKASRQNGLNNSILKELSKELAQPFATSSTFPLIRVCCPPLIKKLMCVLYTKRTKDHR